MIADAIRKINEQMDGLSEKRVPATPIVKYLVERLESDEKLASLVNQEHKTLKKCFDFVYEQASKHAKGTSGMYWIDDNDVYLMAIDYFLADDAELERIKAEEAAEAEEKRKLRQEENRKSAQERAAQLEAEKAQKAVDKKQAQGQMSLL